MKDIKNDIGIEPNKPSRKQGFFNLIVSFFKRFFGRKTAPRRTRADITPIETVGGRGHYFESKGAIERAFQCRSSQSKRRKMGRRTGRASC